jgi:hypothetical protein
MHAKKIKWLIYTVLVGLIPIFCRLLAWGVTANGTLEGLAAPDFIAFGLVLHISNINEIEHLREVEPEWKTVQNGFSIAFIALYSVLYTLTLVAEKLVRKDPLLYLTIVLSAVSFFMSYTVYYHLERCEVTP